MRENDPCQRVLPSNVCAHLSTLSTPDLTDGCPKPFARACPIAPNSSVSAKPPEPTTRRLQVDHAHLVESIIATGTESAAFKARLLPLLLRFPNNYTLGKRLMELMVRAGTRGGHEPMKTGVSHFYSAKWLNRLPQRGLEF
eukprot:366569-Chlamydomonas_euryale.AAC.5